MRGDLKLDEKAHAQSRTLSGGMKRKLSVGIALSAGSKVSCPNLVMHMFSCIKLSFIFSCSTWFWTSQHREWTPPLAAPSGMWSSNTGGSARSSFPLISWTRPICSEIESPSWLRGSCDAQVCGCIYTKKKTFWHCKPWKTQAR